MADPTGRRGRAGLIGLDQALCSATTFLLSALCLRLLPARGFAVFSLFYAAYLLVSLLVRGLTGDVTNASPDARGAVARQAAFTAAVLGTGCAAVTALAGLAVASPTVLTAAAVLPGLVLQDAVRIAAIATYRPRLAVLTDGCWLAWFAAAGAVLVAEAGHHASLPLILGVWGCGAYASAAACLLRARDLVPRPVRPLRWLARHRRSGLPFAGEALAQNGLSAVASYAIAAVAGLDQLALFRAAVLALGPANLLLQAGGVFLVSEAVRERALPGRVRQLVRSSTAILCALIACWLAAVMLAPAHVLAGVFGGTAVRARPLLPYLGASLALAAAIQARQAAIRALQRPALALWTRTSGTVCMYAWVIAGAFLAGGAGAARLGTVGYALALLVSLRGVALAVRAPGATPLAAARAPAGAPAPVPVQVRFDGRLREPVGAGEPGP